MQLLDLNYDRKKIRDSSQFKFFDFNMTEHKSRPDELIIYTDGSSRGNPGRGGYGAILNWNGKMKELSDSIYEGALAFLKAEYRLLTIPVAKPAMIFVPAPVLDFCTIARIGFLPRPV